MYPKYNEAVAINTALYLLNKEESKSMDKVKLMKILYFADREHLVRYGRFISSDYYVKLPFGPVPENIYKRIKEQNPYINSEGNSYVALQEADTDYLSETDIECLDEMYANFQHLNSFVLSELSHNKAWNNAKSGGKLRVSDIIDETAYDESKKEKSLKKYNNRVENELMLQEYA